MLQGLGADQVMALAVEPDRDADHIGSPQLMLAKEELGLPPMGVWMIISSMRARPVMAAMLRPWLARTAAQDAVWQHDIDRPGPLRRDVCTAGTIWGVGFLLTSAVRLALIFTLPVDTAVRVSGIALPAGIVGCMIAAAPWTARAGLTVNRAAEALR